MFLKVLMVSLALVVLMCLDSKGQSNLNLKSQTDFSPLSPNASTASKYIGAGVSLNTGTVGYSVPIFDFQSKSIKLSVGLNYSSSGVKVNESPSLTGMGWQLVAGGLITRERFGAVDEKGSRIEMTDNINTCSQTFRDYVFNNSDPVLYNSLDGEPDLFSFNFCGYSGKFILDKFQQPYLLPKSNLKVEANFTSTLYTFKIITPDGVKYYFGGNTATEESMLNAANQICTYGNQGNDLPVKTAFYLNKIEGPEGEVVTFDYEIYCFEQRPIQILEYCNHPVSDQPCIGAGTSSCPSSREAYYSTGFYRYRILKQINLAGQGRIEFVYTTYSTTSFSSSTYKRLSEIKVINAQARNVRKVSLAYQIVSTTSGVGSTYPSVIPTSSVRPFLSSVSIGAELYSFEYESPSSLPVMGSLQQDFWGYYNGQPNVNLIPNIGINQVECPEANANRNPFPNFAKCGLLNKIRTPTGGFDLITYEGNMTQQGLVGGLRVQKIVSYNNVAEIGKTTKYYYAPMVDLSNPTISGRGVIPIVTDQKTSGFVCYNGPNNASTLSTCTYQITTSQPINDLYIYGGNAVSYKYVTESIGGNNFEGGAIEHEYKVQNYNYAYPVMNGSPYDAPVNIDDYSNGAELRTKSYRKEIGGGYTLLTDKEYTYSIDASSINDKVIGWRTHLRWTYSSSLACSYPEVDAIKTYYYRYWYHLDRVLTRDYDQNGANPKITDEKYYYDNVNHLQVTRTEVNDSKGDIVSGSIKYPADYVVTGNVYEKMVTSNLISPAIETKTLRNGKGFSLKTNYSFDWFVDKHIIAPSIKETQKIGLTSEARFRYTAYDTYGNPTEMSKDLDTKVAFIWDYFNSQMVAEVLNASSTEVAFSSFETGGAGGGWTYPASQVVYNEITPTGRGCFDFSGNGTTYNIFKSGLATAKQFVVTYWVKSGGSVTVNGSTGTLKFTKSGWSCYEKVLSLGTSSVTVAGTGLIDELRLRPVGSLMTTYSYELLVGISSANDADNRITYYLYDNYSRLILVKNMDKQVTKKLCYKFAQQGSGTVTDAENCTIYTNDQITQNYQRECQAGYTGSQVSFIIPQGVFISLISVADANLLASNWGSLVGQAYANIKGTCTPPVCNPTQCTANGPAFKCISGICREGVKVITSSVQLGVHLWECTYHYEWIDGSWSSNYTEQSPTPCGGNED